MGMAQSKSAAAPVALFIYRRPELTRRVFDVLREVRPSKLFVIADGPRSAQDTDRCKATREVVENIDWDCDVHRNYAEANLGLKGRVASGLHWVFSQVDRAVVMEDDCVAHPSFFRFCDELLDRYSDDARILSVSGTNYLGRHTLGDASYYFSRYTSSWGWATWRRAWQQIDLQLQSWPSFCEEGRLQQLFPERTVRDLWRRELDAVHRGEKDSWAFPWAYTHFISSGLAVIPRVNLISNIGFGNEATHTRSPSSVFSALGASAIDFPLIHPKFVMRDVDADRRHEANLTGLRLPRRLLGRAVTRLARGLQIGKRMWRGEAIDG